MSLGAYLTTQLGVPVSGDSIFDVAETDITASANAIGEALVRGAREGNVACIAAAVDAYQLRHEPDLMGADELVSRIGRTLDLREVEHWMAALVAAIGGEHAELALDALAGLASITTGWPEEGRHAICVAVLPVAVALDGPHPAHAANVLEQIANHHAEDAGDLGVAVPRLCELLGDPEVSANAAGALGQIRDPRATAPLIESLVTPTEAAVRALATLQAREAVPALSALLLATPEALLRSTIIYALVQLDPAGGAPAVAVSADPDTMNAHVIKICEAGAIAGDPASRQFLRRAASSVHDTMRSLALTSLARLDRGGMFEQLIAAVEDGSQDVRAAAIHALRQRKDPRAFDAFVSGLRRGHHGAAVALGELGDPRALPALLERLAIDDPYYQMEVAMKEAVIEAIGDIGRDDPDAWDALVARLGHRSDHVGECAGIALQQLRPGCAQGKAAVVRRIERAANSQHWLPATMRRLHAITLRGDPPRDPSAVRDILFAMHALADKISPDGLGALIEAWMAWLATSAN